MNEKIVSHLQCKGSIVYVKTVMIIILKNILYLFHNGGFKLC